MGSFGGLAEQMFELGEHLLDRVQVRGIGRQEDQPRAFLADGTAYLGPLVAAQIVHDDDIAGLKGRTQDLLHPYDHGLAIDGLIEHERCIDPIVTQRSDERHRAPVTVRNLGMEPLAHRCPAPQWGHVGFGPCLINEDEPAGIKSALILLPLRASPGDLRAKLFGGKHAFF